MKLFNWVALVAAVGCFMSMCIALWYGDGRLAAAHFNAMIWAGVAVIPYGSD